MLPLILLMTTVVCVDQVLSYNHIDTPYYKVILTSAYEDNLVGVHLKNKLEQDAAMQEFVAGEAVLGWLVSCNIIIQNIL